jgi:tetratricopeptide (TPR) repeat protein
MREVTYMSSRLISVFPLLIYILSSLTVMGEEKTYDDLMKDGIDCFDNESYELATRILDQAISLEPSKPEAYYWKGRIFEDKGFFVKDDIDKEIGYFEEAKFWFKKSIQLDSNYMNSYIDLAYIETLLGNYEDALKIIDNVIKADPNNSEAFNIKGEIYYYKGNYEEALKYYNRAIDIDPNNPNPYARKGDALNILGKTEEATEASTEYYKIIKNV